MLCRLCCRACQRERPAAPRRVVSSSPLRGTSNFHFLPIHPVFGNGRSRNHSWWREVDAYLHLFLPSFYWAQQSTLRASSCAPSCLPSSFAPPPPPGSRGGRPVSAGPIGKQRPKMCFPTSSPSLTSKHSDRPWKNAAKPSCRPAIFAHDDFHRYCAPSSATKI